MDRDPRYPTFLNPFNLALAALAWGVFFFIVFAVSWVFSASAEAFKEPHHASPSKYVWPRTRANPAEEAWIELGPPQVTGAVATITFQNRRVHSSVHEHPVVLTWEDVTVRITLDYNAYGLQDEDIHIEPPDGLVAVPPVLTVQEWTTGTAHLYPAQASG